MSFYLTSLGENTSIKFHKTTLIVCQILKENRFDSSIMVMIGTDVFIKYLNLFSFL